MNKRGFTLVEGLLVIAIIGIILLAIVPNVITLINKNRVKACESTKESIISSAKMYVAEKKYDVINCGENSISVKDLKNNGYLKEVNTDIYTGNVTINYDCTNKIFSYEYNHACES